CNYTPGKPPTNTAIRLDSNNQPPSTLNEFNHWTALGCLVGMDIGSGTTAQADSFRIRGFHVYAPWGKHAAPAPVPGTIGIRVNGSNKGQGSFIEFGVIQLADIGIDLPTTSGQLQINGVNF